LQKTQVDKLLAAYCAKRVPSAVQTQLRVGYRIEVNAIILYDELRSANDARAGAIALVITLCVGDACDSVRCMGSGAVQRSVAVVVVVREDGAD
jgi:hypothetical protein